MMAMAATPLAYVLAGRLADRIFEPLLTDTGPLAGSVGSIIGTGPGHGIGAFFIVLGLAIIAIVVTAVRNDRIRNLETEVPDVIPYSLSGDVLL